MTERFLETDTGGWHASPENVGSAPPSNVVRLRRDPRTQDVTRLLYYVTYFGCGGARVRVSE